MKKFSKLFWVALVVVAVLACTAIGIFAADTTETTNAVVYGDFVDLSQEGDSFEVGFHFKENNTLVECGKITLTWDETKLTANSIVAANALNGAQFGSKIENGKAVIAWAGSNITEEMPTGKLFTVTFKKASADVTDALIDVTVDDFGYTTETYKSVDMASTVKVNNAFANDGTTVEMPYAEGEDPVAFLNAALERAEIGEGQTVNVVLGDNMVFDAYTVIGAASSNHVGKVVITSNPVGTYGIKLKNNPVVTMYGNYEFSNMLLETESLSSEERYDNALVFPDDCSAVFGEGIAKTESAKPLNIAGNVTVNSGTYCYIAGNAKGSGVKIAKELNITVQGSTVTNYVVGGMIEGAGNGGEVNAKSNVQILGNAKVTNDVIGGGRYTGTVGSAGADVTINTTNSINRVMAMLGSLNEAAVFNIRIVNASEITTVAAGVLNDGGTAGKAVERDENGAVTTAGTEVNIYVDGGTISNFYGGVYTGYSGYYTEDLTGDGNKEKIYVGTNGGWYQATTDINGDGKVNSNDKIEVPEATSDKATNNAAIKGEVNVYINKRQDIDGITYSETQPTITDFYGGSNFSVARSIDYANRTIEVHPGVTFSKFYAGSNIDVINGEHMGDTETTIYGLSLTGSSSHLYGGSCLDADGATHSGNCITTYDKVDNRNEGTKNFFITSSNARIIGGSLANKSTAVHSGDTTVNFRNVELHTSLPANIHGGSYLERAGTKHTGKSTVNVLVTENNGQTRVNPAIYGGSMISNDGTHSGDSRVYFGFEGTTNSKIITGGNSYNNIYGGSLCQGSTTGLAAYHTGDSEVEFDINRSMNFQDGNATVYGGSRITRAMTAKPAGIGNPEDDTYPTSRVILGSTFIIRFRGGSRVEAAATVYQNSSMIITENGRTDENVAGGSEFTADNGKQVGNTSFIFEGKSNLRRDSNTSYDLYVTGGITTTKAGVVHEGDVLFELNANGTPNSTYGSIYQYDLIAAGGHNVARLEGDVTFNIKNGHIKLNKSQYLAAENQPITTAGIYGPGVMVGNITANITGGEYKFATNASFYIGSWGTNTLEAPEGSEYTRGFRQVGDITCNFTGGSTGDQIQMIGRNNDLDGNVYFNMSGTANGGYVHMRNTLAKGLNGSTDADYAYVITGDVVTKISGGTLTYGIAMGGPYSSTAVIEGNNFMEISGGTLSRTDNDYRFELGLGATTNGKDVIKFVGNDFTLDPVETGLAEGKVSGMNIYSVAGNTATLDLWHYTGERDLTAEASNFDNVIYPFNEGSVVTMSTKTWENGTVLSDFVKGQTITVDGHEYAYNDVVAFDEYSDYDNAFDFYASQLGGIKVDTVRGITKVNVAVNTGNLVEKSAEISGFTNKTRDSAIITHFDTQNLMSLSLTDSIAINFIAKSTLLDAYSNVKLIVNFNGEEFAVENPTVAGGNATFSFTGVSPRRGVDTAYFMIEATNKETGKVVCSPFQSISIQKYCLKILGGTYADSLKTVCMDLLNYCAANQIYFDNYKIDTLANDVDEAYKVYATTEDPVVTDTKVFNKIDNPAIGTKAPNVALKDNVQINFTYQPSNPDEDMSAIVAKLTFSDGRTREVNGSDFTNLGNGQYQVHVSDFTPSQMREKVTIVLYKGETQMTHELSYGISDYVGAGMVSFQNDTKLLDVIKTMIKYGDAVKAYVNN